MSESVTYYLKHIPTKEDKEYLISCLLYNKPQQAHKFIDKYCERIPLAEKQDGWKFKFYLHNEKYYQPTKESINNFAEQNNYVITTDTNHDYTLDEFWNIVDEWNNTLTNTLTLETYYGDGEFYPEYSPYSFSYWTHQGFMVNKFGEFNNEGLTFNI